MRFFTKLVVGTLAAALAGVAHAKDRVLPDACGSDAVQFDVTAHKSDMPPLPAQGKAQIVLIQTLDVKNDNWLHLGISDFPTRFGLDGAWLGAGANNSYVTVDVAPGEHHLCGSVQGTNKEFRDMVGAISLTAEAGKVYYCEFKILKFAGARPFLYTSVFREIEPDEGKYRVKASSVSVATPHH